MNTFECTATVILHEGIPHGAYASGRGTGFANSPREAVRLAERNAEKALGNAWEALNQPMGGEPILKAAGLWKRGKLLSALDGDYIPER